MMNNDYQERRSARSTPCCGSMRTPSRVTSRHCQIQPRRPAGGRGGLLDRAIRLNPVYTQAYTYRAITRSRLGNYDDALQDFREAIGSPARHLPGPYYSRGVIASAEPAVQGGHRGFRQVHPPGEQGGRRLHLPRPELPPPQRTPRRPTRTSIPPSAPTAKNPNGYNRRGGLYLDQSATRRPRPTSTRPSSATPPICSRSSTVRWSTTPRTVRCWPWRTSTRVIQLSTRPTR